MAYLAPALAKLRTEVNARWPARSKASDGWIGDAAHASRTSDHNPRPDGAGGLVVDAYDLTHDPAGGCDAHDLAQQFTARGDFRLKYVISNGRIWTPGAGAPGRWVKYTGSNPHTKHVHFSVRQETRKDTGTWFRASPTPAPPATTLEVDVNIESHHIEMPLDAEGRGNIDAPWPIERIIGFLPHSEVRPNVDGRYDNVANTVTFTPNGATTVVVVQGGTPGGRAHLWLRVAA